MTLLGLCLGLFVAYGAACGGSTIEVDNTPDRGEEDEITEIDPQLRQLSTQLRNAECQVLFGCCNTQQRLNLFGIEYSEEECLTASEQMPVDIGLGLLNQAIEEGRIEVDWDAAEMCVTSYRAQVCSEFIERDPIRTTFPGCAQMLIPQRQEGEECVLDHECITGYCYSNVLSETEPDRCAVRPQEGQDCSSSMCPGDMFCDTFDYVCRRPLRAGSSCYQAEECASQRCLETSNGELRCAERQAFCGQ